MRSTLRSLVASVVAAAIVLPSAVTAFAQEAPTPPPPPPSAQAGVIVVPAQPQTGYATPLYQQVQPSYVPQSVAMSGPRLIEDWEDGRPIPPGYHPDTRIRKGFVIAGSILFGSMYLLSALVAAAGADNESPGHGNGEAALWIPGVGPFIAMTSSSSSVGSLTLAIDGLSQAAGLAMLIGGIVAPRTVLVRNDLGSLRITPTPMAIGRTGSGFGLVGTF
jgi:hypothetical protein